MNKEFKNIYQVIYTLLKRDNSNDFRNRSGAQPNKDIAYNIVNALIDAQILTNPLLRAKYSVGDQVLVRQQRVSICAAVEATTITEVYEEDECIEYKLKGFKFGCPEESLHPMTSDVEAIRKGELDHE